MSSVTIFHNKLPFFGAVCLVLSGLCAACSDPNELGGNTDTEMGKVGNVVSFLGAKVGGANIDISATGTVMRNDDGVVILKVKVDLSKDPLLDAFAGLLPASALDSDGNIDTELKLKITDEGIQDYIDGDPHTYIKYDAEVGDTYPLTTSDGLTITREVTARSDQDDFPYRAMQIKTITVESNARIDGIKKITYRANHKFGIVYLEVIPESGAPASVYLSWLP